MEQTWFISQHKAAKNSKKGPNPKSGTRSFETLQLVILNELKTLLFWLVLEIVFKFLNQEQIEFLKKIAHTMSSTPCF